MQRVVITGATSMIGVACIESCLKHGIEVLALVKNKSPHLARLPKSQLLHVQECPLEELQYFQTTDGTYDTFYHFAWSATGRAYRNAPLQQNVNIQYALDAVLLAKRLGCKHFIGAGSQAEYGPSNEVLSPDSPTNPQTAYGTAKYAAGKLCAILCTQYGISFNWVRIFSVYGIYDNEDTMISTLVEALIKGEKPRLTECGQTWDFLYSKDAGEALCNIGQAGHNQAVYCLGSGSEKPLREYVNAVAKFFSTDLCDQMGLLSYAPNQLMRLCADIRSLTSDTGFVPAYSFEEGISETIAWKRGTII